MTETENPVLAAYEAWRLANPRKADEGDEAFERFDPDSEPGWVPADLGQHEADGSEQLALDGGGGEDPPLPPAPPSAAGGDDGRTLAQARADLFAALDDGARCPCCDQHAQRYRWSLYATAARLLHRLHAEGGTERYVETKRHKGYGQGDASRLRFWGLAEEEPDRRPDGGKSGWWRVTQLGEDFLAGRATIPKYVYVYNGTVLPPHPDRPPGQQRTIRDVLGEHFDYRENVHWA